MNIRINVTKYTCWKNAVDTHSLAHTYILLNGVYMIIAKQGSLALVHKVGASDKSDYETNYKSSAVFDI